MRLLISFAALFLAVVLLQLGSGGLAPLDAISGVELGFSNEHIGLLGSAHFVGFFLGWRGNPGRGRALGCGEVKFTGQILPDANKVVYKINMKRVIERKLIMGIADGSVAVDGREIYTAKDLRVGLFSSTESF